MIIGDVSTDTDDRHGAPARAGRRQWWGLGVLCLPTMLAAVDVNVMFLALPHVAADLGANAAEQLWAIDVYGFMIAGFLITMGAMGDRFGRRTVLLAGAAAFLAASVLAAYATSVAMLLVARALLGVAGAAVTPSVLALIRTMFRDPKQLGAAMAVWGTSLMAGIVLGPVIGGLLLGAFWWGSIFLMAVPVMALVLVAGPLLVPDSRDPQARRVDPVSVVLSLAAILSLIYGLKEGVRSGWTLGTVMAVPIGLTLAAVFVRRQRRLANPLLDLDLLRDRTLSTAAILGLGSPLISGGTTLLAVLYLQLVEGLSPSQAALWMLGPSLAMIVVGNLAAGLSRKVRPAYVLAAGAVLAAAGMAMLTQVAASGGRAILLIGLGIAAAGGGAVGILSATLVMSSAPVGKAGSAGSLAAILGEMGTALGVAVLGIVGAAVYRDKLLLPPGMPAAETNAAAESLAGAVTTAGRLPALLADALLDTARAAFTSGLNVVAGIAALTFAALAILAATGLRHTPPVGEPVTQQGSGSHVVGD